MSEAEEIYFGLVSVLRGYLSAASVRASLDTALKKFGLSARTLGRGELPEVVGEAMIGLRMFCDPARIGDLMVDLAEYCEEVENSRGP
jgi:hypothetical protein